jgi:phosphoglycolate phosphatase-like HAD superfamily hydrolase
LGATFVSERASLVLFDIDGTLVDTAGAGRHAIERAFTEVFEIDAVAAKARSVPFAGMTDSSIFLALAEAADIPPLRFTALRADLYRSYFRELRAEMARPEPRRRIMPGVLPLLELLERRPDCFLGLLTGNLETGARIKLEPFGLNRYFAGGGFGSDHPDRREVARVARLKLCGIAGKHFTPSSIIVIGDTEHDVDCASANGYRAVAVETGWASRERLEAARPDALLADLEDLSLVGPALGLD